MTPERRSELREETASKGTNCSLGVPLLFTAELLWLLDRAGELDAIKARTCGTCRNLAACQGDGLVCQVHDIQRKPEDFCSDWEAA